MKIYMDVCCLNRPFDDQTDKIIKMESEAILSIFSIIEDNGWALVGGDIVDYEIQKTPNMEKKRKVLFLMAPKKNHIKLNEIIIKRAQEIEKFGIHPLDALHISSAEFGNVNLFLTTDKDIIKFFKKNESEFKILIKNPINWLMEAI